MTELKKKRIELKLSQVAMSIKLDVATNTYRNWETGQNKPNDINKQVIKDVLGLEV